MKQVIEIDLNKEGLFTKEEVIDLLNSGGHAGAEILEGLLAEMEDRGHHVEVDVPISALIEELGPDEALYEFDNSDIIDHMEGQGFFVIEKRPETMFDRMKMDFFVQNADKISLESLEQLV